MADVSAWNSTAASNNSESPDGFKENMLPSGVNDSAREVMAAIRRWYEDAQWINLGHTPTQTSGTAFTIPTDVTATYEANRRIKMYGSSMGTFYGTISSSAYSAPNTTVNVTMDSGSLTSNLSKVYVSALTATNSAVPSSAAALEAALLGTATFDASGVMTAGTVPLARVLRTTASASSTGVDVGTVETGDYILLSITAKYATNSAAGSIGGGAVGVQSGTATVSYAGQTTVMPGISIVTTTTLATYYQVITVPLYVTAGGTLTVGLTGSISVANVTVNTSSYLTTALVYR